MKEPGEVEVCPGEKRSESQEMEDRIHLSVNDRKTGNNVKKLKIEILENVLKVKNMSSGWRRVSEVNCDRWRAVGVKGKVYKVLLRPTVMCGRDKKTGGRAEDAGQD